MSEPATIEVGDLNNRHVVGDQDCGRGWCGTLSHPTECERPGCGGIVHAEFGDESWDGYWLYTKCDVCGEAE